MVVPGQYLEGGGLRQANGREQTHHQDRVDTFFHHAVGKLSRLIMQPRCQRGSIAMRGGEGMEAWQAHCPESSTGTALSRHVCPEDLARSGVWTGPGNAALITSLRY